MWCWKDDEFGFMYSTMAGTRSQAKIFALGDYDMAEGKAVKVKVTELFPAPSLRKSGRKR
jgi:hypothetical protein